MSGTVEPPKVVVETCTITRYAYSLIDVIPHTSVRYNIFCYNEDTFVKTVNGIIEGEEYKEWTTDDWMDRYIKEKVNAL
jgi:hypothetical protein